ncbi:MAG: cyclic nucleotide-binding domain-containing protein [Actinobacteria bacterium]|nr:cyclic nucleotide-binding domain-containing protein [Actinomycetota bacterium]
MPRYAAGSTGNLLVDALPAAVGDRLVAASAEVDLAQGQVLSERGEAPRWVHFPTRGMVSLVTSMQDGSTVEMATVGREGFVEVGTVLDGPLAIVDSVVQVAGSALRVDEPALRAAVDESPILRNLLLGHVRALLMQIGQITACNTTASRRGLPGGSSRPTTASGRTRSA